MTIEERLEKLECELERARRRTTLRDTVTLDQPTLPILVTSEE